MVVADAHADVPAEGRGQPAVFLFQPAVAAAEQHELQAVGENFRDHLNARIVWRVKDPRVSYNHMARGIGAVTQMMKYLTTGGGFMSLPSAPLLAFLKTRPELATPDVQMHLVPYAIKDPKTRKLQDFPSMTISVYQLRPESLGSIHIRSKDPNAHPAIRFNFLHDPIDQAAMVAGFRMMRQIVDAAPMDAYRGEEFSPGASVSSKKSPDRASPSVSTGACRSTAVEHVAHCFDAGERGSGPWRASPSAATAS